MDNNEIHPDHYILPNRVRFPEWVHSTYNYGKVKTRNSFELYSHQKFVRDYLQPNSPYRGLLLFHDLGVGKTCTSIVTAETLMKNKDIIVMLPASLKKNFIEEIKKCGNHLYVLNQNWQFVKGDQAKELANSYNIPSNIVKKYNGIYFPNDNGTINKDDNLRKYLNDLIQSRYTFIHYNGITKKKVVELAKEHNNFENKLVIIDEAHNFVSKALNPNSVVHKLYQKLLHASNSKLILLSGTPIINKPFELAYMLNLVHGLKEVFTFSFLNSKKDHDNEAIIHDVMQNSFTCKKYVDWYEYKGTHLEFCLLPGGFEFKDKSLYRVILGDSAVTKEVILQQIGSDINRKIKGKILKKTEKNHLLPTTEESFNDYFIDFNAEILKNKNTLNRRLQGLVSHFEQKDSDSNSISDYPEQEVMKVIKLEMSKDQFQIYHSARLLEMKKEKFAKRNNNKKESNMFSSESNVFKAFSRAACSFTFPLTISRPYPTTMEQFKEEHEIDYGDVEYSNETKAKQNQYKKAISEQMKVLESSKNEYLKKGDTLSKYSPKYNEVLISVENSPGPVLVYSQFREIEGLGILSLALNANNFCEFKIKKINDEWVPDMKECDRKKIKYIKFDTKDDEHMSILLDIFNSQFSKLPSSLHKYITANFGKDNLHGEVIKLLMVTQSGSEGISLRNVRQVHIMEPYWNVIRVQQVIGRAIRANSHIDLKEDERKVQTFMYVMKLTDEQKRNSNEGKSSDEYIYDIAERKKRIIQQFLGTLKETSVDCSFHKPSPKINYCYSHSLKLRPNKMIYTPHFDDEFNDKRFEHMLSSLKIPEDIKIRKIIKFNDQEAYLLETSDLLIDKKIYDDLNRFKVIGNVIRDGNNKINKLQVYT